MITTQKMGTIAWVDALSPTNEEILQLQKIYNLNDSVTRDLMTPTLIPRIDECDKHLYIVLHFPANRHSHRENPQEIDFIIGKNYLITVHYDTIDTLYLLFKAFEVGSILSDGSRFTHAFELFFVVARKMYASVIDELSAIEDRFDFIEEAIFENREKEMVVAISRASRTLLDFKRILIPHEEVFYTLQEAGVRQLGVEFSKDVSIISKEYHRARNRIHDDIEALIELRETNNTLLSTKQNEIIKIFTILAFITFPLTLITDIIQADRSVMWILILLVCVSVGAMFMFFRHKKWL
jgi:magnesium transporter